MYTSERSWDQQWSWDSSLSDLIGDVGVPSHVLTASANVLLLGGEACLSLVISTEDCFFQFCVETKMAFCAGLPRVGAAGLGQDFLLQASFVFTRTFPSALQIEPTAPGHGSPPSSQMEPVFSLQHVSRFSPCLIFFVFVFFPMFNF